MWQGAARFRGFSPARRPPQRHVGRQYSGKGTAIAQRFGECCCALVDALAKGVSRPASPMALPAYVANVQWKQLTQSPRLPSAKRCANPGVTNTCAPKPQLESRKLHWGLSVARCAGPRLGAAAAIGAMNDTGVERRVLVQSGCLHRSG